MTCIWLVDSWFNQTAEISPVLPWWSAESTKIYVSNFYAENCGP